jgi:hypothetical protein
MAIVIVDQLLVMEREIEISHAEAKIKIVVTILP